MIPSKMVDWERSNFHVVFTMILCSLDFFAIVSGKLGNLSDILYSGHPIPYSVNIAFVS